jgi:thioredoxin type arsenate reductase
MKPFVRLMKALSDPNRVKIIKMLQRRRMCVCELQVALGIAQPTVSSHLKVLEEAGLVEGAKQGQWVYYSLAAGETEYARALLGHLKTWLEDDPEVASILSGLEEIRRENLCSAKPGKMIDQTRSPMVHAKRVLFICVHNSARSQMAEALLNSLGGDTYEAASGGFEPREINPLVVEAMAEEGLDISGNKSKSVFDLFKSGRIFDYVITVCDDAREGQCPIFPGVTRRLHIPFTDPSALVGTHEEKMAEVRKIRDAIKDKVRELMAEWADDTTKRKLA